NVDEVGTVEGRGFSIEVAAEGKVHGGGGGAIEEDLHVAGCGLGRPRAPDAAGALHVHEHTRVAFLAHDAAAVVVGAPRDVFVGGGVVLAAAVVAGGEAGL